MIAETLGKQLTGFDQLTGLIRARQSGNSGSSTNLQDPECRWDKNGNMECRLDHLQNGLIDELNRLDYSEIDGVFDTDLAVNVIGNITNKTGVGSYNYTAQQAGCSKKGSNLDLTY